MAITLTETAAGRVKTFLSQKVSAVGLRFGVTRTGCSGYSYVVDLADEIADDDQVYTSNGVKVVVDAKSVPIVDGTNIDFGRQTLGDGFIFHNPNAKNDCGCGESFGV